MPWGKFREALLAALPSSVYPEWPLPANVVMVREAVCDQAMAGAHKATSNTARTKPIEPCATKENDIAAIHRMNGGPHDAEICSSFNKSLTNADASKNFCNKSRQSAASNHFSIHLDPIVEMHFFTELFRTQKLESCIIL